MYKYLVEPEVYSDIVGTMLFSILLVNNWNSTMIIMFYERNKLEYFQVTGIEIDQLSTLTEEVEPVSNRRQDIRRLYVSS